MNSQDISSSQANPSDYFKEVLRKSGFELSSQDDPNILIQEQALVVRDLERFINDGVALENVEQFSKGLKIFCRKEKNFRKSLLLSVLKRGPEGSAHVPGHNMEQESLFRLLLKTESLQEEAMNILLDEIISAASEDNQDDTSWLRMLLNPLRFLAHIKNSANLASKLLDVLDIGSLPVQMEILNSIPHIIPDDQYSEVSKQLCELMENEKLTAAVIDCLNALRLEPWMRTQVQERILGRMLAGIAPKTFPYLLEFLLYDNKPQNVANILIKIRNALDNIIPVVGPRTFPTQTGAPSSLTHGTSTQADADRVAIFTKLQMLTAGPKMYYEGWLSVIGGIKVHSDHKAVDFLILFMLHAKAYQRKRNIELLFRKRVKEGLFKCNQLERLFEKYLSQQLLKNYFYSMVEVGRNLLRTSREANVIEFASTLFKLLFSHEHTPAHCRKELIDNLITLIGMNDVGPALNILKDLVATEEEKMRRYAPLLMRLLENMEYLCLSDVRDLFEILCRLTAGVNADDSLSSIKDELHIIIRKQLANFKKNPKFKGIISSVVMAKHIASTLEDQSDLSIDNESMTVEDLPRGRIREAADILELTNAYISDSAEYLGLFYDQLASMIVANNNLDKYFSAWLFENVTNDFQTTFIAEAIPSGVNDLDFISDYSLNTEEEMTSPIHVNVAKLTLQPETCRNSSILVLASHFRLLRLLHYKQEDGDLSTIDALLGCGIILPKIDFIDSLDHDQLKQYADCLFHCINWFREIISGFVTQKNKTLRLKVIQRLQNLIEVEHLLTTCMSYIPEHKLPQCYFDSLPQPSKPEGKIEKPKRAKKAKPNETAPEETISSTAPAKNTPKRTAFDYQINFRDLDTDVVILLKYPLASDSTENTTTLTLDQLNFLLKDLNGKFTILTQGKKNDLSHLSAVNPMNLIYDCRLILPNINKHMVVIIERIGEILDATDRDDMLEIFTAEANKLKACIGLILDALVAVFSWSGFQHSRNLDLLRDLLKAMQPNTSLTFISASKLSVELINRLATYTKHCLHVSHAASLIKLMNALFTIMLSAESKKIIISAAHELLSKRWYNNNGSLDTGKQFLADINLLIETYLDGANIKTLCGLVTTLQNQAPNLTSKEDSLPMLRSIDKTNFHIFYRALCNALYNRIKIEIESLTNQGHLTVWKTTILTMQGLMTIAKLHESRPNLVTFLKKSIAILKVFLSHGIPILEIMLKSEPDSVVEILKTMQTNTRFLHHLCCQSKLTKDAGLVAHVPQFRLVLETLIYRVKAALVANNCSAAFWMGNLKNRDLHGEDILSQSTVTTDTNGNSSDVDMPEDDKSDEEEEDIDHSDKSDSEVYE